MSEILTRFPPPPGAVRNALAQLQILRRGDGDEIAAAGDLVDPPRPWDPATCPNELREAVWSWCDSVAEWLNHEYAWRPTQMIPLCWPHHAHIAANYRSWPACGGRPRNPSARNRQRSGTATRSRCSASDCSPDSGRAPAAPASTSTGRRKPLRLLHR